MVPCLALSGASRWAGPFVAIGFLIIFALDIGRPIEWHDSALYVLPLLAVLVWKGRWAAMSAWGLALVLGLAAVWINPPRIEPLSTVVYNRLVVGAVLGMVVLFAWWKDLRQAETEALRDRLEGIARATNDAIWDYDLVKNELWWTQGHQMLFGVRPSPRIEDWYDGIHPEDRARVVAQFRAAIDGTAVEWRDEYRYRRHDGSYAYVLDRAEIRRDVGGRGLRMVGGMSDVTVQRRAFLELSEANAALETLSRKYRALIEQAISGVYLIQHGRLVFVNAMICVLLQRSEGELLALPSFLDVIAPEDRPLVEQRMTERLTGAQVSAHYELRVVRPDGSLRWIEVYGTRIEYEGAPAILGVANDVTERKEAEASVGRAHAELARLYRQYHTLVERAVMGIYIVRGQQALYVNPMLCRLVGRSKEEILAMPSFVDSVAEQDRPLCLEEMRKRFSGIAQAESYQLRIVRPDGSLIWLEVFGTLVEYEGQPAILGTAMDVTGRLKAEERQQRLLAELVAARERLQALSRQLLQLQEEERRQIARDLHDEIGQALTLLRADLTEARRAVEGSAPRMAGERLEVGLATADSLIERVRAMSLDLRPAMLDDLGLPDTIRWFVDRIARRAGWVTTVAVDDALEDLPKPVALVAFRILQESLTNTLRHAAARSVAVEAARQDGELHLTVRDDGQGFDVERAWKRAGQGGSVGLLSMQERLHMFGGEVTLNSRPGAGTTVQIRIPLEVTV
ncbi:MAG: PAS domain S-box protein [Nitrospira sp.]